MYTTQHPVLFFIYREGFIMNLGIKNPIVVDEDLPFSQQPTSSPLVFDSVQKNFSSTE